MSSLAYKQDQKLQTRLESEVRQLSQKDANRFCADCRRSYTRYVSVTLGVFLCNQCFGVHRSLGAHISRTKCLGLDSWSEYEVQLLASVGNDRGNSYWEGHLPADRERIHPGSTLKQVEEWIRDKYERKLFVATQGPPPHQQNLQPQSLAQPLVPVPPGHGGIQGNLIDLDSEDHMLDGTGHGPTSGPHRPHEVVNDLDGVSPPPAGSLLDLL